MYEIGVGGGMSWAYGDLNRTSLMYDPEGAAQLAFRYNFNLRWAMAIDMTHARLKGDSRDFDNAFPDGRLYSFSRRYTQVAFRPEFSYWNYGWGADYREKHRLAPFLTMGIGFGWASGESSGDDRTAYMLSVPIGAGLKWKMAPRWDMQLTCLWSKVLGDQMDGIVDPYQTGSKVPMNTDWTGSAVMSITFSFGERCLECHNQNE